MAVKEGFCQVASRPPKPASATPESPPAAVRWMGGSDGQAAATTRGADVGAGAGVDAGAASVGPPTAADDGVADGVPEPSSRPPRPS
ncbi:hypothetical protein [Streptomyces sp. NPDC050263]|uniref:hypothetical protein n=1 Tax=Streptomyces sp. NPDC050263 TaxID=3155037 RepID=UPI00341DD190